MSANKHEIISAGCSEAAKMKSAVAGAPADASVNMNAAQFATLADLIQNLCEIALGKVSGSMGDPRYWVPLEEYAKLKRENQQLAAQSVALDLQLTDWAPASPDLHGDNALLGADLIAASRSLM